MRLLKKRTELPEKNEMYPLPEGYRRLSFDQWTLLYRADGFIDRCAAASNELKAVRRIRRLKGNAVTLCRGPGGQRLICFYRSVPSFDAGDREWDSYRKLYIRQENGCLVGYQEAGGYAVAKISKYPDIRPGGSWSAYWLKKAGLC